MEGNIPKININHARQGSLSAYQYLTIHDWFTAGKLATSLSFINGVLHGAVICCLVSMNHLDPV